ncbi:hypothetical protein WJ0W_005380 [Paenibacillus melissococcoides]|uniref:DUF3953 domain-containing protein n=1 Tax=Paenibacillus melissococcoides TaxID=2912268 RepID=A0ABN8UF27_9BACL|nr:MULTISPECIES: hypothetical protein [Paenibacillus]MEB9893126.1 hypothetical protein [Bacillus cereus]CAH8248125.1 hypothetical protein WJ0W_005380 [Paenibacillus melissococcoides]CAH8718402.1 hypothetical protein HTL2_005266 [Paenibacillus melissococcoides]CAH8718716.1 hypothetical protein WDD9_005308 [Paenibacillus melissococcoides]GIO78275.1 hypothetical protein J6TS7_18850 [Paenibacillus dendritiformis]
MNRFKVFKYLAAFGVFLCGVAILLSKENKAKAMYMGIMLLISSFGVFNEAIALRVKKENKAQEVTEYIIGSLVFILAWLILLGLFHGF